MVACRHCRTRNANRRRGLCASCYYTPGVLVLYPSTSKYAPTEEPTEAELDALIAEQSKPENLPVWWDRERRKQQRGEEE